VSDPVLAGTLTPFINAMKEVVGNIHDTRALIRFQGLAGAIASDRGIILWLAPLFKTVLKKSNTTAWICSSDQLAFAALAFLQNAHVDVPGKISVIGFDNWREAYEHQLSTFDFNMHGIIQESLLMIMDEKSLKARPVMSEVDGYVVERRTTRR
jgi:hypothetical protein